MLPQLLLAPKQFFLGSGSGAERKCVNLCCNISQVIKWITENSPFVLITVIRNLVFYREGVLN